jgi:hypothetical protein
MLEFESNPDGQQPTANCRLPTTIRSLDSRQIFSYVAS